MSLGKDLLATARSATARLSEHGVRGVVLVALDGQAFAVVSYGETKAECRAISALTDAIADAMQEGLLPIPLARAREDGEGTP